MKGDRDTPKDGGLILRVVPDGQFIRFAHGFQRPWGLTFDPQGNLYVTDPKAGTISRFLAPAAPALAPLPESTTEAKIELSGTAEPEATITVRGGVDQASTAADLEGKFTLDVPLVPDQVNALKVYATGAKGDGLTSAPASATMRQQTGPSPPSITIVLQITAPAPGATITADSVLVRGFVDAGGLEVGVTVNTFPAAVQGNTLAALVPVSPGPNTLTAVATTATGATATQSVSITVAAPATPAIALHVSPASGVSPLRVAFSVLGGPVPTAVNLDLDGNGTVDFTGSSLEAQTFTYTQAGLFFPAVTITDTQGNQLAAKAVVQVHDQGALDTLLQSKWTGMKAALQRGDAPAALQFITSESRGVYQEMFSELSVVLPTVGADLADIRFVEIRGDLAEYELLVTEDGQNLSYYVEFIRDIDGIWRVNFF